MSWKRFAKLGASLIGQIAKPKVQGFVDAIVHQEWIVGWAHEPRRPLRRLEVAVLDGNGLIASTIADLPRKDLVAAKVGDGRYGFRVRLPAHLLRGASRTVTVCALIETGRIPLERGRLTVGGQETVFPTDASVTTGMLERVTNGMLHGWAYNPTQPDGPVLVDVYDDERFLGTVTADRNRPHLHEKGLPRTVRGFVFDLDMMADQRGLERLRARVAGMGLDLKIADNFLEQSDTSEAKPEVTGTYPTVALGRQADSDNECDASCITLLLAAGGEDKRVQTLASWTAQSHPHLAVAISAQMPATQDTSDILWLDGESLVPLKALLARSHYVCLARPGERFDAVFATTLSTLPGFADVVRLDEQQTPLASLLARPPIRAFAVRGSVLLRYPGDLSEDLRHGMLHGIEAWLASEPGLRWFGLGMPAGGDTEGRAPAPDAVRAQIYNRLLADRKWIVRVPAPAGAPLLWPASQPASLSIGIWRGWQDGRAKGLAALLAEDFSGPIEILIPAGPTWAESEARLGAAQALCTNRPGATCRLIDASQDEITACADLTRAASHEALILIDAGVCIGRGMLPEILGWAMHPPTGAVGINPVRPDGSILAGGAQLLEKSLQPYSGNAAMLVDKVHPRFLAIATARLILALDAVQNDWDDLTLGLRLKQFGHSAIILGHVAATANAEMAGEPQSALPWHLAAKLRASGLLPR